MEKILTKNKKREALTLVQTNRLAEAKTLYAEICRLDKADVEAWFMQGAINGRLQSYGEAEACFRRVIALHPKHAEAHDNLGVALQYQGKLEAAVEHYREAMRIKPEYAGAHFNLGNTLKENGRLDEALSCYREAVRLEPGFVAALTNLALTLEQQGKVDAALACLQQALRNAPHHGELHYRTGVLLGRLQRFDEAAQHYKQALQSAPNNVEALYRLAGLYLWQGGLVAAAGCYEKIIALNPDDAQAHVSLGFSLLLQGEFDAALASNRRALTIDPDLQAAAAGVAMVMEKQGDYAAAYDCIRPFLNNEAVYPSLAAAFGLISGKLGREEQAIALMERLLETNDRPPAESTELHFGLARLYDRTARYDQAFEHFKQANEAMPLQKDITKDDALNRKFMSVFTRDFLARAPRAANGSDRPIFIVGMPRSGTSLTEQILASHPQVFGAGELIDMIDIANSLSARLGGKAPYPECVTQLTQDTVDELSLRYLSHLEKLSVDARRVTDKMPGNYWHLGLIALLFPNARILHCIREPLDTCLSCYFQDFGGKNTYTKELQSLGAYYRFYRRLMGHWKQVLPVPIMDVRYEELVEDQEKVSRAMIEFCGLEWDADCLQFHKTERVVNTASYDQVRQPIYRKSVARWKHYEAHLGPLIAALNESE